MTRTQASLLIATATGVIALYDEDSQFYKYMQQLIEACTEELNELGIEAPDKILGTKRKLAS